MCSEFPDFSQYSIIFKIFCMTASVNLSILDDDPAYKTVNDDWCRTNWNVYRLLTKIKNIQTRRRKTQPGDKRCIWFWEVINERRSEMKENRRKPAAKRNEIWDRRGNSRRIKIEIESVWFSCPPKKKIIDNISDGGFCVFSFRVYRSPKPEYISQALFEIINFVAFGTRKKYTKNCIFAVASSNCRRVFISQFLHFSLLSKISFWWWKMGSRENQKGQKIERLRLRRLHHALWILNFARFFVYCGYFVDAEFHTYASMQRKMSIIASHSVWMERERQPKEATQKKTT